MLNAAAKCTLVWPIFLCRWCHRLGSCYLRYGARRRCLLSCL